MVDRIRVGSICRNRLAHRTVLSLFTIRFVLDGKDAIQIRTVQWHKSGSSLCRRPREFPVELLDIELLQKPVRRLQRRDLSEAQFLRQTSLPSSKAAFATTTRLR